MLDRLRSPKFAFGVATAVLVLLAAQLYSRFPEGPLAACGQILGLMATMPPLFYFMTERPQAAKKIGGIASAVIWIVGIALAFVVPSTSKFIFVPDALLLLGFFPLLYLWKYSIPWLVFGALNFGIGILLLVIQLSDDSLFPKDLLPPKHHLAQYHPPIVWYVTGTIAFIFGAGRLIKNVYLMIRKARSAA